MKYFALLCLALALALNVGCSNSSKRKNRTGGNPEDFKERRAPIDNDRISKGLQKNKVDIMSNPSGPRQGDAVSFVSQQTASGNNYVETNQSKAIVGAASTSYSGFTKNILSNKENQNNAKK